MKLLFILCLMVFIAFNTADAQQLNYTWGTKLSGATWAPGIALFDTTAGTTNDIYVDLSNYFPFNDINPIVLADTADFGSGGDSLFAGDLYGNTDRFYIGTFYVFFDNYGAAPTADSLADITIKATPGVYSTANRTIAGAKFGTAITLETVRQVNDYLSVNNVYIKDSIKLFPPEIIKLQINAPATTNTNCDDSTAVYWKFVFPEVYHQEAIQILKTD